MPQFLLRFFRLRICSDEPLDSDFDESQWVWIEAPDEEAALSWGREVAEFFARERWPETFRLRKTDFAAWIESEDPAALEWARSNAVPACKVGEFPER